MTSSGNSGGNQPGARTGLNLQHSHNPPPAYDPPVVCEKIAEQRDVMVPMRDSARPSHLLLPIIPMK
jgi:hypothetical protein